MKRQRSSFAVLCGPIVDWPREVQRRNRDQIAVLRNESCAMATTAARLATYAAAIDNGRTHRQAVRISNNAAAKVRRALGYTYPRHDITF